MLINNTIVNNGCYGIKTGWNSGPEITNCIIWGNGSSFNFEGIPILTNNCIEGFVNPGAIDNGGNIFIDPCFIDVASGNYHLQIISPCIEAGTIDTTGLHLPEFDLDGNSRIQDGNGDSTLIIDMGCYESETITNPGFIRGTITLIGGTANVEDVNVGVGAPVHPDENGDYLITIGAGASSYNVTAWMDDYLPQTIYNVPVIAGQITENIDFELEFYQPDEILIFSPDSLQFITTYEHDLTIQNVSLLDVNINWITFYSTFYGGDVFYYLPDLNFPYSLNSNDSLEITVYLNIPTDTRVKELLNDTLYIYTNIDQYSIPIVWDTSLWNDVTEENILQTNLSLFNNYPNPFNPITKITFLIPSKSAIEISIFNLKGQKVKTLEKGIKSMGKYTVTWDGTDDCDNPVSSGLYLYKFKAGDQSITKKMFLIK